MGQPEGALRAVRRSLPATEGRRPPRGAVRAVPRWSPPDFALSLAFAGGELLSPRSVHVQCRRQPLERPELDGRVAVRRHQEHWWRRSSRLLPTVNPLSPPITGFTGMGLDGVGWGTAVTRDTVWATSFNGKILVMDFNGRPIGKEERFPFKKKLLGLMGIGVSANGEVWIADGSGAIAITSRADGSRTDGSSMSTGSSLPSTSSSTPESRLGQQLPSRTRSCVSPPMIPPRWRRSGRGSASAPLRWTRRRTCGWRATASLDFPIPRSPMARPSWSNFGILGGAVLTTRRAPA